MRPRVVDSLLFSMRDLSWSFFAGLVFIYDDWSAGLCFIVLLLAGGRSIFVAAAVLDEKAVFSALELFLS